MRSFRCTQIFSLICWHQQKYKKWETFHSLMTITLGATITTRQMTPFFIYSLSSTRCCISFLHLKTFKVQFLGVPSLRYFLVCKIHIYIPMMTLSRLLTQISFLYKKFSNFRNTTYFVPNSITIWPEFHGLVTFMHT